MEPMNPKGRNPLLLFSMMIALFALQGCGILDESTPEIAKIVVTGGSAETFQLVTTTDFDVLLDQAGENREVNVYSADTTAVSSPYSKSYSLGPRVRFYMKAFSAEGLALPVTIKVLIDGEQRFYSTSTLEDLPLEFNWAYR